MTLVSTKIENNNDVGSKNMSNVLNFDGMQNPVVVDSELSKVLDNTGAGMNNLQDF